MRVEYPTLLRPWLETAASFAILKRPQMTLLGNIAELVDITGCRGEGSVRHDALSYAERARRRSGVRTELREAADRAFAGLRRAADAFCARLPSDRRPPALMMSLHLWALAHGIASLFGRADGGRRKLPMSPEELLEAGVLVYLRGLSLIDDPPTA